MCPQPPPAVSRVAYNLRTVRHWQSVPVTDSLPVACQCVPTAYSLSAQITCGLTRAVTRGRSASVSWISANQWFAEIRRVRGLSESSHGPLALALARLLKSMHLSNFQLKRERGYHWQWHHSMIIVSASTCPGPPGRRRAHCQWHCHWHARAARAAHRPSESHPRQHVLTRPLGITSLQ